MATGTIHPSHPIYPRTAYCPREPPTNGDLGFGGTYRAGASHARPPGRHLRDHVSPITISRPVAKCGCKGKEGEAKPCCPRRRMQGDEFGGRLDAGCVAARVFSGTSSAIHPHHPLPGTPGLKPPESAPRIQLVPRELEPSRVGRGMNGGSGFVDKDKTVPVSWVRLGVYARKITYAERTRFKLPKSVKPRLQEGIGSSWKEIPSKRNPQLGRPRRYSTVQLRTPAMHPHWQRAEPPHPRSSEVIRCRLVTWSESGAKGSAAQVGSNLELIPSQIGLAPYFFLP